MSAPTKLNGILGAVVLAILLGVAWRSQHALSASLPPPVDCIDARDAMERALALAVNTGGAVSTTSGTPSMEPWIHGHAIVVWHRTPFADVPVGSPILYHPLPGTYTLDGKLMPADTVILHVLAARDAGGGIPAGINTPRFENWGRVTEANFVGIADKVFRWPQP